MIIQDIPMPITGEVWEGITMSRGTVILEVFENRIEENNINPIEHIIKIIDTITPKHTRNLRALSHMI